jgi:hypothetical protein
VKPENAALPGPAADRYEAPKLIALGTVGEVTWSVVAGGNDGANGFSTSDRRLKDGIVRAEPGSVLDGVTRL